MTDLFVLAGAAGLLAAVLANIGFWAPRKLWIKLAALLTVAVFLPTAYAAFVELLGRPKPVDLEWAGRGLAEAAVLGAEIREGEAIYLWLRLEGVAEPRGYALPWNDRLARQLHEARREAEAEGSDLRMRLPFASNLEERDRRFYPAPRPATPPKQPTADGPVWFQRPLPGRETGGGEGSG